MKFVKRKNILKEKKLDVKKYVLEIHVIYVFATGGAYIVENE